MVDLAGLSTLIVAFTGTIAASAAAYVSIKSMQVSKNNAAVLEKTKETAVNTETTVKELKFKIDGNLEKWIDTNNRLIDTLKEKNILDKSLSYTAGASDQRAADPGVTIVASPIASIP